MSFGGNSTHLAADNTGVSVVLQQTTTSDATLTQAFGTIAGTVRGSESGTPTIDGINVTVYDGTTPMGSATTASGGTYSIGNLPVGTYRVHFSGDSTHLGTDNLAVAVVIQQTTTSNAVLTQQAFGTISGTVRGSESGTPTIDGINVTVYDGTTPMGSATTASGGTYSIGNLPSGTYKVSFGGNANHLGEWNLDKSSQETADLVSVTIPLATDVDASLTEAYGAISGTVTGSDGPALSGIEVTVYTSDDTPAGTASTDTEGNYSVGNLPTGNYKVSFGGNANHLDEWNLDKSSQGTADLVSVTIPSATDVDATLTEAYGVISGTVRGNESGTPVLSNIEVAVYNGSDVQVGSTAYTDATWRLLHRHHPHRHLPRPLRGQLHPPGSRQRRRGRDHPFGTSNIDAVLTEAYGAISGTVTGSEGPALPGIEVTVYTSADALMGTITTDASGNYSVGNLPSGTSQGPLRGQRQSSGGVATWTRAHGEPQTWYLLQSPRPPTWMPP